MERSKYSGRLYWYLFPTLWPCWRLDRNAWTNYLKDPHLVPNKGICHVTQWVTWQVVGRCRVVVLLGRYFWRGTTLQDWAPMLAQSIIVSFILFLFRLPESRWSFNEFWADLFDSPISSKAVWVSFSMISPSWLHTDYPNQGFQIPSLSILCLRISRSSSSDNATPRIGSTRTASIFSDTIPCATEIRRWKGAWHLSKTRPFLRSSAKPRWVFLVLSLFLTH